MISTMYRLHKTISINESSTIGNSTLMLTRFEYWYFICSKAANSVSSQQFKNIQKTGVGLCFQGGIMGRIDGLSGPDCDTRAMCWTPLTYNQLIYSHGLSLYWKLSSINFNRTIFYHSNTIVKPNLN